jgi:hypothetical protein
MDYLLVADESHKQCGSGEGRQWLKMVVQAVFTTLEEYRDGNATSLKFVNSN